MMLPVLVAVLACAPQSAGGASGGTSADAFIALPVGVPHWSREVVLPGSRLKAAPATIQTPVILRIDSISPHGTDFRYDLEYYGLDPGTYDLTDFMEREDGSSSEGLPALLIRIESALAPGQVKPNPVPTGPLPSVGGYRTFLWLFGSIWFLGAILLWRGGHGRTDAAATARATRPPTLAERLTPLVEQAREGTLSQASRAELELMLIAFWRARLGLQATPAAEALVSLKEHPDAGPLLRQIELWLHSPGASADVDVAKLLAPYRDLPAEEEAAEGEVSSTNPAAD
jgi:hypothetical protein